MLSDKSYQDEDDHHNTTDEQVSLLQLHLYERGYLKSGNKPLQAIDSSKYQDFSYKPNSLPDKETEQFGIYRNLRLNDQDEFGTDDTLRIPRQGQVTQDNELSYRNRNLAIPDFVPSKYRYPIEKRPRGTLPMKEFFLTMFLIAAGLFFIGVGFWSFHYSLDHEFAPFIFLSCITLFPGLYQGFFFLCAFFDINETTYNDIPRAPGWS